MLSLLLALMLPASAAGTGKVVYENDFSGTEIDETMWYLNTGTVAVTEEFGEKFLRCTPITSGARAVRINFGPQEAKNVDVSFKIRARANQTNTGAYLGIYFRSISIPANALFAYQLRLNATKTALVHVNNHYDTTTTTLTEDANTMVSQGLWYNVKLCLRENRIVVYINGTKIMDLEDESNPAAGGFGLCGVRYTFDVDDLVMTQYSGKTLPEPEPNEVPVWVGAPGTDEEPEFADTGEERLNLFGTGGEKVSSAVSAVDPNKMTVNSYIAIGLIAALVLMAASTLIVALLLVKSKKREESEAAPAAAAAPRTETESEKEEKE